MNILNITTEEENIAYDNLVRKAINSTFVHSSKFGLHRDTKISEVKLGFYDTDKNNLLAAISGTIVDGKFISHSHLTYGGLLFAKSPNIQVVNSVIDCLVRFLKAMRINTLIYKPTPLIYHNQPFMSDLYCIKEKFKYEQKNLLSSTLDLSYTENNHSIRKKRNIKRAKRVPGLSIQKMNETSRHFYELLQVNLLDRYKTKPVHSFEELAKLLALFPENIEMWIASIDNKVLAGSLLFLTSKVDHIQYIATSEYGREVSAGDLLIQGMIENSKARYFDFGISNNRDDTLNESLFQYKNEFGSGTTLYEHYWISLK